LKNSRNSLRVLVSRTTRNIWNRIADATSRHTICDPSRVEIYSDPFRGQLPPAILGRPSRAGFSVRIPLAMVLAKSHNDHPLALKGPPRIAVGIAHGSDPLTSDPGGVVERLGNRIRRGQMFCDPSWVEMSCITPGAIAPEVLGGPLMAHSGYFGGVPSRVRNPAQQRLPSKVPFELSADHRSITC
jgi:hypothetical protein